MIWECPGDIMVEIEAGDYVEALVSKKTDYEFGMIEPGFLAGDRFRILEIEPAQNKYGFNFILENIGLQTPSQFRFFCKKKSTDVA